MLHLPFGCLLVALSGLDIPGHGRTPLTRVTKARCDLLKKEIADAVEEEHVRDPKADVLLEDLSTSRGSYYSVGRVDRNRPTCPGAAPPRCPPRIRNPHYVSSSM